MASIQLCVRAELLLSPETSAAMRDNVSPFCTRWVSVSAVPPPLEVFAAACRAGDGAGGGSGSAAAGAAAEDAGSAAAAAAAAVGAAAAVLRSIVPSRVPLPVAGEATGALATCD